MVKSKLPPRSGTSLEAVEPHPQKGAIKVFFSDKFWKEKQVLERKTGKEIPGSSRLAFLETFFASTFALSEAEEKPWSIK